MIKRRLKEVGKNQNDIARFCDVTRQVVSQVVAGTAKSERIKDAIAMVLGIEELVILDANEQCKLVKLDELANVKSWEPIMQDPTETKAEGIPVSG